MWASPWARSTSAVRSPPPLRWRRWARSCWRAWAWRPSAAGARTSLVTKVSAAGGADVAFVFRFSVADGVNFPGDRPRCADPDRGASVPHLDRAGRAESLPAAEPSAGGIGGDRQGLNARCPISIPMLPLLCPRRARNHRLGILGTFACGLSHFGAESMRHKFILRSARKLRRTCRVLLQPQPWSVGGSVGIAWC